LLNVAECQERAAGQRQHKQTQTWQKQLVRFLTCAVDDLQRAGGFWGKGSYILDDVRNNTERLLKEAHEKIVKCVLVHLCDQAQSESLKELMALRQQNLAPSSASLRSWPPSLIDLMAPCQQDLGTTPTRSCSSQAKPDGINFDPQRTDASFVQPDISSQWEGGRPDTCERAQIEAAILESQWDQGEPLENV
jgi:hypothetical protein